MQDFFTRMVVALQQLRSDESGATAVEYGLMVAAIAAVIIVAVKALGADVAGAFGIDF